MENIKKRNLFNFTFLSLIFIGVVLTTCGIILAITKHLKTEVKHTVKIQNKFAKLIIEEDTIKDHTFDKFLIPKTYPYCGDNDTYIARRFLKLKTNNINDNGISKFLKVTIKHENDEIDQYFTSNLFIYFGNSPCNYYYKCNSHYDYQYNDNTLRQINKGNDYNITFETQQECFIDENIKEITVIVEYELVDSQGKPFEGTKNIIKTQIVNNNT